MRPSSRAGRRILGAIDLAIEFATLGEYGLEPLPTTAGSGDRACRERPGRQAGWEAFANARRGRCGAPGEQRTGGHADSGPRPRAPR